LVFI